MTKRSEPIDNGDGTYTVHERRTRHEQWGVRDPLASPEQLEARAAGRYDPRPASGRRIGRRVKVLCGRCGQGVAEIEEFEKRILYHSLQDGRWTIRKMSFKCAECYAPLETFSTDAGVLEAAVDAARATGKVQTIKVGAPREI